jgi:hypothetical protein
VLLTAKSVFVHIPKTGGHWVASVVKNSGVRYRSVLGEHALPDELLPVLPDRLSYTFIRDPVTWWRSFWQWSAVHDWAGAGGPWTPITDGKIMPTYREFMEQILERCPGQYGRIVEAYTAGVDRVGRAESLRADLAAFLAEACEAITVPDMPAANVGMYEPESASTPELDAAIRQAEKQVIDEFYGGC